MTAEAVPETVPEAPELYTPEEVAARLRARSDNFLRAGVRSGKYPHHRVSKRIMFSEDDIRVIMSKLAHPAKPTVPDQSTGSDTEARAFKTSPRSTAAQRRKGVRR